MKQFLKALAGSAVGASVLVAAVSFSAPASARFAIAPVESVAPATATALTEVAFRSNRRIARPAVRSSRGVRGVRAFRGRPVIRSRHGDARAAAVVFGAAAVTAAAIASSRRAEAYPVYRQGYPVHSYPVEPYPVEAYPVETYNPPVVDYGYSAPSYGYGYGAPAVVHYARPRVRPVYNYGYRAPRVYRPAPVVRGPGFIGGGHRYVRQQSFVAQPRVIARPAPVYRGGFQGGGPRQVTRGAGFTRGGRGFR